MTAWMRPVKVCCKQLGLDKQEEEETEKTEESERAERQDRQTPGLFAWWDRY